jgi:hypothetical protein
VAEEALLGIQTLLADLEVLAEVEFSQPHLVVLVFLDKEIMEETLEFVLLGLIPLVAAAEELDQLDHQMVLEETDFLQALLEHL